MAQMKDLTVRINVDMDSERIANVVERLRMAQVWRYPQAGDRLIVLEPKNPYDRGIQFEVAFVTKRTIYVSPCFRGGCRSFCKHSHFFEPDQKFILISQAKFRTD